MLLLLLPFMLPLLLLLSQANEAVMATFQPLLLLLLTLLTQRGNALLLLLLLLLYQLYVSCTFRPFHCSASTSSTCGGVACCCCHRCCCCSLSSWHSLDGQATCIAKLLLLLPPLRAAPAAPYCQCHNCKLLGIPTTHVLVKLCPSLKLTTRKSNT